MGRIGDYHAQQAKQSANGIHISWGVLEMILEPLLTLDIIMSSIVLPPHILILQCEVKLHWRILYDNLEFPLVIRQ